MDCKFSSTNLSIPHKLSSSKPQSRKFPTSILNCRAQSKQESLTAPTPTQTQPQASSTQYNVKFQTLQSCRLGISRYPDFEYNAEGGGGTATVRTASADGEELSVAFDVESLYIPALTGATTRFLGLPLPPFLKIEIAPELFRGTINSTSGKVEVEFRSRFWFSIGSLYRAPPLVVGTTLTTEESAGSIRRGEGERVGGDGSCRLVGVATVQPVNDLLLDSFLSLPTECIADLRARISISSSN